MPLVLRLDQVRLGGLQFAVSGIDRAGGFLGSVACGRYFGFGALAFGDVRIDQHEAAACHRVVADFQHAPVGPRALIDRWVGRWWRPALRICSSASTPGAEVAALGEKAEMLLVSVVLFEQIIGEV